MDFKILWTFFKILWSHQTNSFQKIKNKNNGKIDRQFMKHSILRYISIFAVLIPEQFQMFWKEGNEEKRGERRRWGNRREREEKVEKKCRREWERNVGGRRKIEKKDLERERVTEMQPRYSVIHEYLRFNIQQGWIGIRFIQAYGTTWTIIFKPFIICTQLNFISDCRMQNNTTSNERT
jgi:hypothetical protein